MNLKAIKWLLSALLTLGVAAVSWKIGATLMPPMSEAQRKGTLIPWVLTWGMVWETIALAVLVAGFLVVTGLSKGHPHQPQVAAGRP
jgi:hypothetical protein